MKSTRSLVARCFRIFSFAVFAVLMTNTVTTTSAASGKFSLRDFEGQFGFWQNNRDDNDDWSLDKPGASKLQLKDSELRSSLTESNPGLASLLEFLDRYSQTHDLSDLQRRLYQIIAQVVNHGHSPPPVSP